MSVRLPHHMETVSGLDFNYLAPEVNLEDVAHGLAHECRFGRHTSHFYSVAEHSILVAALVNRKLPELTLPALWHDAHEAYMGDVPTPLKDMLGAEWKVVAQRIDKAVADYLGLESYVVLSHPVIKWADRTAMLYEASLLKQGPGWAFTRALDHNEAMLAALEQGISLDLSPGEALAAFKATHTFARVGAF